MVRAVLTHQSTMTALILLGFALCLSSTSVSSVFMMLYIYFFLICYIFLLYFALIISTGHIIWFWSGGRGDINKTVSLPQYCVPLLWCTMERAVLTGRLTGSGFDLASFSSVSAEHLCYLWFSWCSIYSKKIYCYILFFTIEWAKLCGINLWSGWLTTVLQCHDAVGHVTHKIVPKMTYVICQVGR